MGFFDRLEEGNPSFRMKMLKCPFCHTDMEFSGQYGMSFDRRGDSVKLPEFESLAGYPRVTAYICPACRYMALFRE